MSCCSKSSLSLLALAVSLPRCLTPPLSPRELGKARSCTGSLWAAMGDFAGTTFLPGCAPPPRRPHWHSHPASWGWHDLVVREHMPTLSAPSFPPTYCVPLQPRLGCKVREAEGPEISSIQPVLPPNLRLTRLLELALYLGLPLGERVSCGCREGVPRSFHNWSPIEVLESLDSGSKSGSAPLMPAESWVSYVAPVGLCSV